MCSDYVYKSTIDITVVPVLPVPLLPYLALTTKKTQF